MTLFLIDKTIDYIIVFYNYFDNVIIKEDTGKIVQICRVAQSHPAGSMSPRTTVHDFVCVYSHSKLINDTYTDGSKKNAFYTTLGNVSRLYFLA